MIGMIKATENDLESEIGSNGKENELIEKNPIQVADRIFHVIELLADHGPAGLMELSGEVGLNKTTVHRILNSLIYMGYVRQDPLTSKYALTFKIWEIANKLLMKIDIIEIARPYLKELVDKTGETVHLVQIDDTSAIYIDKVEAYNNPVRLVSKVGQSIPLYCSGVGKALLAQMPDEKIRSIWSRSRIKALTPHTVIRLDDFMKKIAWTRKHGYALDDEENELGVRCIAVAVTGVSPKVKYAMSISAPTAQMNDKRIKELADEILKIKQQLSGN